jgi:thioredoxin reductase (NADPH)
MEEAIFLTRFASQVTVVHRRDTLRASKIMQDKAFANPKISFEWNSDVEAITDVGKGEVTGIVLRNNKTGERKEVPVEGVFVGDSATRRIRHSSRIKSNWIPTAISSTHMGSRTNVRGVFACGDVQDHVYRQAITAAGTGCMAAIDAEHFLDALPQHLGEPQVQAADL